MTTSKLSLWQLEKGASASISSFAETLNSSYVRRLVDLGFSLKSPVVCEMRPGFKAPRLFRVRGGAVYALDFDTASQIFINTEAVAI